VYFVPPMTGLPLDLGIGLRVQKLELCGYLMVQKFKDMFSHFNTIPACDGRTDRHVAMARTALCKASPGKKMKKMNT